MCSDTPRLEDSVIRVSSTVYQIARRGNNLGDQLTLRGAIATLPDELDPCEFLEERTADEFRQLIEGANDAFDHAVKVQTQGVVNSVYFSPDGTATITTPSGTTKEA